MRIHTRWAAAAALFLAVVSIGRGAAPAVPKVGDVAPLVEGKDQAGSPWRLADEAGKKVVLLYFYPKDDTPGCTKEACGLRDQMADLTRENVRVVGVSFDSQESHQKFIGKYSLNFSLISDPEGKIAEAYGARGLRARHPSELRSVLEDGLRTPGVVVIDVHVTPEENVFPMVPPGAGLKEMVLR